MALSSSEHTLLVNTCENMNIAAETCRQVLDMLRSLGASGVVDIAEHNNATNAHENAKNLFQKLSDGTAVLGTAGEQGGVSYLDKHPYNIKPNTYNGSFDTITYANTITNNRVAISELKILDITDSSNSAVSKDDLLTFFGGPAELYRFTARATVAEGNRDAIIGAFIGSAVRDEPSSTTFRLGMCGTGNLNFRYEIGYNIISPLSGTNATLGTATTPFNTAYFSTAPTTTSDRREKDNVSGIGANALDFVKALKPVQYTMRVGEMNVLATDENGMASEIETIPGIRQHWGFIAQEVKQAMTQAGIEDAAVWCLSDKNDPDSKQSLRYEELIAPLVKAVQVLAAKVEALEAR